MESSSTHISRDSGPVDRVLLCCKEACHLAKVRIWAMSEVGQWNIFSAHPLKRREILRMICCPSWESLPGRALCTLLGAVALWSYIEFLPPFRAGTKFLEYFLLLLSLLWCPIHAFQSHRYMQLKWQPYLGDAQSFNPFHWYFCLSKVACCSELQSLHTCPSFTRQYKKRRQLPDGE